MYTHSCSIIVNCESEKSYRNWIFAAVNTERNAISLVWRKLLPINKITHAGFYPPPEDDEEVLFNTIYV